jgi:hypothetical protein
MEKYMAYHKNINSILAFVTSVILATIACKFIHMPLEQKSLEEEEAFRPVCTPPACKPGEEYYCPGECPGGCGTICVTSVNEYYGCAFTVNVPAELSTEDIGWDVWFTPTSGDPGWVSVHAKKMPGIDLESAFEQAANQYGVQLPIDQSIIESVTVIDYLNQPLQGLQADLDVGDDRIHLLVVVRPDTMLGDLAPEEVIYEITARAPIDIWDKWEPVFDEIFQSFQILECGGV